MAVTRVFVFSNHKGGVGKSTSVTNVAPGITGMQPRRVLPETVHLAFHNNRLTPIQALKELVQLVQVAAGQRGRPFNSVLELLAGADDDRGDEPETKLSPEEQLLRDLINLAITIRRVACNLCLAVKTLHNIHALHCVAVTRVISP